MRSSNEKTLTDLVVADCIYKKKWAPRPDSSKAPQSNGLPDSQPQPKALSAEDDAKLIFGTIFSLRNMVKKLGGPEDKYESHPFLCRSISRSTLKLPKVSYHIERATISCTTMRHRRPLSSSWSRTRRQIISELYYTRSMSVCMLNMVCHGDR